MPSLTHAITHQKEYSIIAMAGADGKGCDTEYIKSIYGPHTHVVQVPVSTTWPRDLGQTFSQRTLDTKAAQSEPSIFHAVSAGTATGFLYAVHSRHRNQLTGLVLEGMLASPSAAARFRALSAISKPIFWSKPVDYLTEKLSPTLFGKYVHPQLLAPMGYLAFMESPLEAASRLTNKKLPIIIVEQYADDHVVSPIQSRAMYYRLRDLGCTNVYFMQSNFDRHVNLIDPTSKDAAAIKRIMAGHETTEDKTMYQPDPQQFADDYRHLIQDDRRVRRAASLSAMSLFVGSGYLIRRLIRR